MQLPNKTVERLSQYRRVLQQYQHLAEPHIFSHDLAKLLRINPVQVRRDLMLIGFSGSYRNGYKVIDLLNFIDDTLPIPQSHNATIIGMEEMGRALLNHISSNSSCPVLIPATFDIDPKITNQSYGGVYCYDITKAPEIISKNEIKIAILAISPGEIQELVDSLILSGIKSIVNFSAGPFRVPRHILLKEYDIRQTLEEISYFLGQNP